ncbi:MAG: hypothetical protein LBH70_02945 [Spirochaetaceae bacterium]|jgi:hypothetical protein|nr:hypothetical protein [Spirochaetaceae bacterium]
MVKKIAFGLALSILIAGGVSAIDFGKINSSLGQKSFTVDLYSGLFGNNGGANFEWGIGGLPITLGLGLSPFIIGEYAYGPGIIPI